MPAGVPDHRRFGLIFRRNIAAQLSSGSHTPDARNDPATRPTSSRLRIDERWILPRLVLGNALRGNGRITPGLKPRTVMVVLRIATTSW